MDVRRFIPAPHSGTTRPRTSTRRRLGHRLMLAFATVVAVTMATAQPAASQTSCGTTDPSWTPQEEAAWRQLCAGEWADVDPGETPDPEQIDGWGDDRVLSSAFVEQLLTEPYVSMIDRHGIRLRHAWFRDTLDLVEASIGFPLRCIDCRISELRANNALISGALDLRGSTVERDLVLSDADIGGDLHLSNGTDMTDVMADGLALTGDLRLRGGSTVDGELMLADADIGGELDADETTTVRTVTADGLTVADSVSVFLGSGAGEFVLSDADIAGDLLVGNESGAPTALTADGLRLAGDLRLGPGSRIGSVVLSGSEVRGRMSLGGVLWSRGAVLDLRDADVGVLSVGGRSATADDLPARLEVDGLTVDRWASGEPPELGPDWFTRAWLGRLDRFSPGPYDDLSALMDASGYPTIAADIRYSRSHLEREQVPWSTPERWGRELHRAVLGYGLRPWWALYWAAVVWLFGVVVLWVRWEPAPDRVPMIDDTEIMPRRGRVTRWSRHVAEARHVRPVTERPFDGWQAVSYSLDHLVPSRWELADPTQFDHLTHAQQMWMRVQPLIGAALTLFIVGWLGSLIV